MKPQKKVSKSAPKAPTTHKTKEDFLRWYREQDARKKKEAEDEDS